MNWLDCISGVSMLLLTIFLLSGCTQAGDEQVVIGAVLPLTGDVSSLGEGSRAAIERALEEINNDGGINGKSLEVIYEDTQCTPQAATKAVQKFVNVDDVDAIIGPECSSNTLAVSPLAERSRTVLVSPCSSAPEITNAGEYIFRTYPSDTEQGRAAASMARRLNASTAAVLSCKNSYCGGLHDVFKQAFEGRVVAEASFAQGSTDLRTQLAKIRAADPDLIYFPSYTESAVAGLTQMQELDMNISVLASGTWSDPKLLKAGDAAEGIMFTKPYTRTPERFKSYIMNTTGLDHVPVCTAQSYDVTNILASVMRDVGTDSNTVREALYNVSGFEGVSGNISFDANGDLKQSRYVVRTVRDGEFVDLTVI